MKHVKKFNKYKESIRESVLQMDDTYKVKIMVDVPQSLVNAYVKKVKDVNDTDLRSFYGDVDIAEELVKHVVDKGLVVDAIGANVLVSGEEGAVETLDTDVDDVVDENPGEVTAEADVTIEDKLDNLEEELDDIEAEFEEEEEEPVSDVSEITGDEEELPL